MIKNFNPAWFASIMGTGILPISLAFADFPGKELVIKSLIIITIFLFLVFLLPFVAKFLFFFKEIKKDLRHPIIANFFPTMPISLIIIALNLLKFPDMIFSPETSKLLVYWLWIAGVIGIYGFSFIITTNIFCNQKIDYSHASFGWFIPPVSALIVPLVGFELSTLYPLYQELILIISMASFGVGFFLLIFVGATVYHRYIYHELPMSKLAPTLFIALSPTSIIAIIIYKMIGTGLISLNTGKLLIMANLGLSFWWFVIAISVITHYIKKLELPYALSWWAFTFPTGSLTVATGILWKITGSDVIYNLYISILLFFVAVWTVVFLKTLMGLKPLLLQSHHSPQD